MKTNWDQRDLWPRRTISLHIAKYTSCRTPVNCEIWFDWLIRSISKTAALVSRSSAEVYLLRLKHSDMFDTSSDCNEKPHVVMVGYKQTGSHWLTDCHKRPWSYVDLIINQAKISATKNNLKNHLHELPWEYGGLYHSVSGSGCTKYNMKCSPNTEPNQQGIGIVNHNQPCSLTFSQVHAVQTYT